MSPTERLRATITEAMLLHPPEDEEDEEEDFNGNSNEDEEMDEKAAAKAQQVDEAERRRIATLREEYRFATQLLKLRLLNGVFPSIPKDEDEEEEEEKEEDDDYEDKTPRQGQTMGVKADVVEELPPPTIRYFDEVMAVMVRWRLRQEDCRNQGYILESFPETVRQAWLTFMADTEEQKEMQRPKLQKDRDAEEEPRPPPDAGFPLPVLTDLGEEQQRDILDLMAGRTFASAEEVLAPTNDAFFPDCFIVLTGSEIVLRSHIDAAAVDASHADAMSDISELFTRYMTHNRPGAPPTESLVCWFQTVVAEKEEREVPDSGDAEAGARVEQLPRKACVLFVPVLSTTPAAVLPRAFSQEEVSDMEAYCAHIRCEILNNVGLGSCSPVIESMRAEEEATQRWLQEFTLEHEILDKLYASEEVFAARTRKLEDVAMDDERRALRYYQAKEELASIASIDTVPVNMYLMRYVLPSLTPLMAEVVRMRPEDPVTVLADALFHYKRQIEL
ncbi:hypothetical protein TraAM80_04352 [Trypanosoma rangeli]|uniref:Uncharacterized protein n=1 Tax=Trypanosoma rangeli TaxID=5698 RepID=A0A3R7RJZ6_TRYRA|nr:uncharacterized protein TraAM80_04352 [Trypanosoma rangeli]RNF05717.1 hypothetical protein TraAM80_04352 [Trypanosoma rangeli]|eukprot:RNF05717.1 hypothetical protein TraAM80_04352 [Trypanosoma rangeli]